MGLPAFRHFIEYELGKFPHFVLYAILECTLISLLFTEGLLAFVAYEFAKIFDLTNPCSLCTRIDHLLVHRSPDFYYNDAMCEDHKKDISSLAYCHVHGKLSDIRNMCEGCLLSFNADARSSDHNSAMSKNLECLFDDGLRARLKMPYWVKDDSDQKRNSDGSGYFCSCCGEPMKVKSCHGHKGGSNNNNNNANNNNNNRLTQAPTPSPRAFAPWRNEEARNLELSHVNFTELKLPDTSSLGDEDDGNIAVPAGKEDPKAAAVPSIVTETDEVLVDDPYRSTPTYTKGASNKFFALPLPDSTAASPRWASRVPRKSLLDRVELAQDPVEACCANDSDADTVLNRLKRQVRLDRKSLIALYMELDEERSASAIAANNAMAMITRLQAEKAAVQMEALQYQRMMEEQAEYDQEALQAMREMLDKRDEEIRELVTEVDLYRQRYGIPGLTSDVISDGEQDDGFEVKSCSGLSMERSEHGSPRFSSFLETSETHDFEHDELEHEQQQHFIQVSSNQGKLSKQGVSETGRNNHVDDGDDQVLGSYPLDFERERSYLLGQLRMLESKIFNASSTGDGTASLSDGSGTTKLNPKYETDPDDNLSSLKKAEPDDATHTSTSSTSDHNMDSEPPPPSSPTDHTAGLELLANSVKETDETMQSSRHESPQHKAAEPDESPQHKTTSEPELLPPHMKDSELPRIPEPELLPSDRPNVSSAAAAVEEINTINTNSNHGGGGDDNHRGS